MLGAYFSEKDLKPRFTESVLKRQKDSRYKFSDDEDELLEAINNPTMRSSNAKTLKRDHPELQTRKTNTQSTPDLTANHKISIEKPVEGNNDKIDEQEPLNRDEKLTQLLHDCYYNDQRKFNASQQYLKKYPEIDTTLHWSKEGKRLAVDTYGDSIVPQTTIDQENTKNKIEQQKTMKTLEIKIKEKEDKHRMIEQHHEKILQENSIKKLILSNGHKGIFSETEEVSEKIKSHRFHDPTDNSEISPERTKNIRIKNTDWYKTEIRKAIENKLFDCNEVSLDNFNEIHENFKLKEAEIIQSELSLSESNIQIDNKTDEIRAHISQILEAKKDCLIRFNEIDAMLKLIKDRFHDFKRSQFLVEFFKSASFTLYILTLNLNLPDNHFYRIVGKYDEITYENTIKLIIRCKIFYEAREKLANIIKMINEREYTAALIQTEIAAVDSMEQIDDATSNHLKQNLVTLLDQSKYIESTISKFRQINPFDRPFIYKDEEYVLTMNHFYGMLNRVLEVHEINLDKL